MNKKTGLTSSKMWRFRVKEKAIKYYLQSNTNLRDVADRISAEEVRKVSVSFVHTVVTEATKEWEKENAALISVYKYGELERLNNLEREAWAAWVRSCQPERTVIHKKTPVVKVAGQRKNKNTPEYLLNEVIETERESAGNKRFLDTVQWCIDKRIELMASMQQPTSEADQSGTTVTNNTTIRQIVFKGRMSTGVSQTVTVNEK